MRKQPKTSGRQLEWCTRKCTVEEIGSILNDLEDQEAGFTLHSIAAFPPATLEKGMVLIIYQKKSALFR